jgi:hypothetical protein
MFLTFILPLSIFLSSFSLTKEFLFSLEGSNAVVVDHILLSRRMESRMPSCFMKDFRRRLISHAFGRERRLQEVSNRIGSPYHFMYDA